MNEELIYIEIDAESGVAEVVLSLNDSNNVDVTIENEQSISIVVKDSGIGQEGTGLQLGETHEKAYYGDLGKAAYLHSISTHAVPGEPQFNNWLNTNPLSAFLSDAPVNGNQYVRKNGGWAILSITVPDAWVSNIFTETDPTFPIDYLKFTIAGTDYVVTDIPKADGILSGGYVSWISGFIFAVNPTAYYISGKLYTVSNSTVSLDAADLVNPRIDIICVDINRQVIVIKGTPAVTPQKPTPNPLTQIELTQIFVPANVTEPDFITSEIVYDENIEWTGSFVGTTVVYNSLVNPIKGTYCINVTGIGNNDSLSFTNSSLIAALDYETFSFAVKLKQVMSAQHTLFVTFYNDLTAVSTATTIVLNKSLINTWQVINLKITDIPFINGNFNKVTFTWTKSGQQVDHLGFYLDLIKFEVGITQPISTTVESDPIFTAWNNAMFGVGAKQTGTHSGLLGQRSITDDYEYVCVQGGAIGVAIWKKIVLFHT